MIHQRTSKQRCYLCQIPEASFSDLVNHLTLLLVRRQVIRINPISLCKTPAPKSKILGATGAGRQLARTKSGEQFLRCLRMLKKITIMQIKSPPVTVVAGGCECGCAVIAFARVSTSAEHTHLCFDSRAANESHVLAFALLCSPFRFPFLSLPLSSAPLS